MTQAEEPVENGAVAAAPEDWSDLDTPDRPSPKRYKVNAPSSMLQSLSTVFMLII